MTRSRTRTLAAAALLLVGGPIARPAIAAQQDSGTGGSDKDSGPITTIIAVLRPRGFEPDRVTVPAGKVSLLVINRAGPDVDPDLSVDDDNSKNCLQAKASQRGAELWQVFKVSKGRKYKIRLSNHSKAVLVIEVQQ
jgi:hypothetical protein